MKTRLVGHIDAETIQLLHLDIKENTPIFLGESNYKHLQTSHPDAFTKYFRYLEKILAEPDYVNLNPRDNSIKYIKQISEYVVIGVRVSAKGTAFARTIFIFEDWKFKQYQNGGYLKVHTKKTPSAEDALSKSSRQGD